MAPKSEKKGGPHGPVVTQPEPLPPVESAKPIPPSKITDELERAAAEAQAAPRLGPESEFDDEEIDPPSELLAEPTYIVAAPPPAAPAPASEPPAAKAVQAIPK